jgi:hypothetical protein
MHVAVALVDDRGSVTTHAERLAFAPFRHEALEQDLRSVGLAVVSSTYGAGADRYLVLAERR